VCEESEVLKVKVPLLCPSTEGVPAHREGRYSELPCPESHPEYDVSQLNPGPKHDLYFWVLCGCKSPLHYHPLREESLDDEESLDYECLPGLPELIKAVAGWSNLKKMPFNIEEAQERFNASNAAYKR
jgi:hypothetical protein